RSRRHHDFQQRVRRAPLCGDNSDQVSAGRAELRSGGAATRRRRICTRHSKAAERLLAVAWGRTSRRRLGTLAKSDRPGSTELAPPDCNRRARRTLRHDVGVLGYWRPWCCSDNRRQLDWLIDARVDLCPSLHRRRFWIADIERIVLIE